MPFLYDGKTGAEIQGNVITLHLVDGDRSDEDGITDGVIVAPGAQGQGGTPSWNTPVLQAVQPFGDAGPGRLFLEGSVTSSAPIGATAQVNFLRV